MALELRPSAFTKTQTGGFLRGGEGRGDFRRGTSPDFRGIPQSAS